MAQGVTMQTKREKQMKALEMRERELQNIRTNRAGHFPSTAEQNKLMQIQDLRRALGLPELDESSPFPSHHLLPCTCKVCKEQP